MEPVIVERYRLLSLDDQPAPHQIAGQNDLADGFQKARAETLVQLVGGIHDLSGDVVQGLAGTRHCRIRVLRASASPREQLDLRPRGMATGDLSCPAGR